MRPVVAAAVEREDECLAVAVDKAALYEERRQVGLKRPAGQRPADCDVDTRLRARWQPLSALADLMYLAGVAGSGEGTEGSQRLGRKRWPTGGYWPCLGSRGLLRRRLGDRLVLQSRFSGL